MKKYAETVITKANLLTAFHPERIDQLQAYSFLKKEMKECDYQGWTCGDDDTVKTHFGSISDFDFEITENQTRFFFGFPLFFYYDTKSQQIILKESNDYEVHYIELCEFQIEHHYPAPKSMLNLAEFIDDFLARTLGEIWNQKLELLSQLPTSTKLYKDYNDLPF